MLVEAKLAVHFSHWLNLPQLRMHKQGGRSVSSW